MTPIETIRLLDYLVEVEKQFNELGDSRLPVKERTSNYFVMLRELGLAGGRRWRSKFHGLRKGIHAISRGKNVGPELADYYNERRPIYSAAMARVQTDNVAPGAFNQVATIDFETGQVNKQGVSAPGVLQVVLDGNPDPTAPHKPRRSASGVRTRKRRRRRRRTKRL